MAIALDTLAYARRLREAGFTEQQAEGQANALAAAMTDTLATTQDLHEMQTRFDSRFQSLEMHFDSLEQHLDGRFAQQEKRFDGRLDEQEKRFEIRLDEQEKRLEIRLHEQERRLEIRLKEQEQRLAIRFAEQESRVGIRFDEQAARFRGDLADLERRMTMHLGALTVTGFGVLSVLVTLF